jgi:hypothetical protein
VNRAASSLLDSIIDYAGLFPPAQLGMGAAVARYAAHRRSAEGWMLARFVVPATRLGEFGAAAAELVSEPAPAGPWRLAALLGADVAADAARVTAFNTAHLQRALVDTVELKAGTVEEIERVSGAVPRDLTAFVELPLTADLGSLLRTLRACGARAKVRTGGVVPGAIPATADLAAFLVACAAARVPFKATAGLHHAVRGRRSLTYAADAPHGTMHGFLNVFAAATLAWDGADAAEVEAVLCEQRTDAFRWRDDGLAVGDRLLEAEELARARAEFAMSFGSCSFDEPVADLQAQGAL